MNSKYQLRVWHRSGLACWDADSVEHGWRLWASFVRSGGYYAANSTTTKVVLADSPL